MSRSGKRRPGAVPLDSRSRSASMQVARRTDPSPENFVGQGVSAHTMPPVARAQERDGAMALRLVAIALRPTHHLGEPCPTRPPPNELRPTISHVDVAGQETTIKSKTPPEIGRTAHDVRPPVRLKASSWLAAFCVELGRVPASTTQTVEDAQETERAASVPFGTGRLFHKSPPSEVVAARPN